MRRTRNRKHRGGWPFGFGENSKNAAATPNVPEAPVTPNVPAEEKPGFLNSLFGNKKNAPAANPVNAAPAAAAPTGGKRKNRCNGLWGGSQLMGAPINYSQVQATGGQPSERIMQRATTAGGRRRKHRTRRNKSHRNKSHRNKSHRKSRRSRKN